MVTATVIPIIVTLLYLSQLTLAATILTRRSRQQVNDIYNQILNKYDGKSDGALSVSRFIELTAGQTALTECVGSSGYRKLNLFVPVDSAFDTLKSNKILHTLDANSPTLQSFIQYYFTEPIPQIQQVESHTTIRTFMNKDCHNILDTNVNNNILAHVDTKTEKLQLISYLGNRANIIGSNAFESEDISVEVHFIDNVLVPPTKAFSTTLNEGAVIRVGLVADVDNWFDGVSAGSSRMLVGAVTDPESQFSLDVIYGFGTPAWSFGQSLRSGDIAANFGSITSAGGIIYKVTKFWSNYDNGCVVESSFLTTLPPPTSTTTIQTPTNLAHTLTYNGGRLVDYIDVIPIAWDLARVSYAHNLQQLYKSIINSNYYCKLSQYSTFKYRIRRGIVRPIIDLAKTPAASIPGLLGPGIHNIQNAVDRVYNYVNITYPTPNYKTYLVYHLPPGVNIRLTDSTVTCQDGVNDGGHTYYTYPTYQWHYNVVIIADCSATTPPSSRSFDDLSVLVSKQLVKTVLDPDVAFGFVPVAANLSSYPLQRGWTFGTAVDGVDNEVTSVCMVNARL
ncbi:hypothetical protein HDU76_006610 [Blyttiomyces sp. JEL0837]|nr:hypothetical protein HDU76_006610 [Blyttiomyces sp. JEL0837]